MQISIKHGIAASLAAFFLSQTPAIAEEARTLPQLQAEAEAGSAQAQFDYALKLFKIKERQQEGVEWIKKSAAQGDAKAQYLLGDIYLEGRFGVKADMEKTREWAEKSAGQGFDHGQRLMGIYMWNKKPEDIPEGCAWFTLAGDEDNIAQCQEYLTPAQKTALPARVAAIKKQYSLK